MREPLHPDDDRLDRGLAFDLGTLTSRRRALQVLGAGGLLALVGCSSGGSESSGATTSSTTTTTSAGSGAASTTAVVAAAGDPIPTETAGPFPGDGTNGPDALAESGIVRRDLTTSVGSAGGVVSGVPLTLRFTVQDAATGTVLAGAAVYAWHCDAEGRYSLYSSGVEDENWLRGVQEADAEGALSFATIFPGCYPGRWPHVHFEVFDSVAAATGGGTPVATSQLAFPQDAAEAVYADEGYPGAADNLAQLSIESDMVFADGVDQQLATMAGSAGTELTASLVIAV